jgi:DMSO/TMAO reductase YedYZ molybdopterin-dependent catalytic subunit
MSSPDELLEKLAKKRTRRSFITLLAGGALAYGGWHWLRTREGDENDDLPWPLRRVLEFNRKLSAKLFAPDRVAPLPKPPRPGTDPRFNGDLGLSSPIDLKAWRLQIESPLEKGGSRELEVSIHEIKLLPRTDTATEFRCIEGWSDRFTYAGVRFSDFLREMKVGTRSGLPFDPKARPGDLYKYVGLETPDGEYYVSIDMESMLHPQTLLAYEMNEAPLAIKHGAPLRLIIPVKYGIKSLKRIGKIFFSDVRPPDYWAERGYDWFAGL